jgi:hypothetical protein
MPTPKGPKGSAGRSHNIDAKILKTSNRQLQAKAKGNDAEVEATDRIMRHLAIKGGGTTDAPMEGEDG